MFSVSVLVYVRCLVQMISARLLPESSATQEQSHPRTKDYQLGFAGASSVSPTSLKRKTGVEEAELQRYLCCSFR